MKGKGKSVCVVPFEFRFYLGIFFEELIKGWVPQAFEWLALFKSEEREIYPAYILYQFRPLLRRLQNY